MIDVAQRADVALSTVSYALNGTRAISDGTRRRILQAMEELGYRPNALARGLASKRTNILALLFPTPERGLGVTEMEFATGAADAARERGYHLILSPSELRNVHDLEQLTGQGLIDGAIVMEVRLDDERVELLAQAGIPFSMIGRPREPGSISYADIDFEQTTRDAIAHLAGLGHRCVGFLNHSPSAFSVGYGPTVRAADGFRHAASGAGLVHVERLCDDNAPAGRAAFHELRAGSPELTGLVVMNERAVVGVIDALDEIGWTVPDDFSLVSIVSSTQVTEMMRPKLTTFEPPSAELGRLGVQMLFDQLDAEGDDPPPPTQELLPCRLVVGGSSGPPPRRS
ncbi:LacI family transcriptional regulator [Actinobacteria bacterium YIM 96077]|uniref:LacI family transcriptional regulator n=2 Tax=Phytoactinopolyspora halophila TaxID=1981511 RepID=A0A329R2B2_9ACTN|nr:LacI family transcriptional regulator [Actinobacteria bacterium YIM 96077]RAW17622.1 LacI family transcriptional regulator [Phytoactinopolyspora halophila]